MKSLSVTIQMKATEQYLSCGAVYYAIQVMILTFESVCEKPKCDNSKESY